MRIHRLPSRPSHPYGRQPHSLIFMSTLYKASSRLPAKQLTNDHEPACMCHLYRLRINTHVLTITMPCFIARQIQWVRLVKELRQGWGRAGSKRFGAGCLGTVTISRSTLGSNNWSILFVINESGGSKISQTAGRQPQRGRQLFFLFLESA